MLIKMPGSIWLSDNCHFMAKGFLLSEILVKNNFTLSSIVANYELIDRL